MRVSKISNYLGFKIAKIEDYIRDVDTDLKNLFIAVNSKLRIGTATDGATGESLAGQFQVYTSNATPDTEDTMAHTLSTVPNGFIILKQDKAGSLYAGSTAWTSNNIYLKSSVASVTYTLFLLK